MSPEDEKYYETYFDLFATEGWKQLIAEIEDILKLDRIEDIKDEKNLYYLQGERNSLNRLVYFENSIKGAYDTIKEAENVSEI